MLTPDELQVADVRQWAELSNKFAGADLLLGNGFSIQLARQFDYVSLFAKFIDTIEDPARNLFMGLETTNFEELQRMLLEAKKVAALLGQPLAGIDTYVAALQEGLIRALHDSHPKAADIAKVDLTALSKQLDQFNDIFTTSYDLFLYRTIMVSKDRHEGGQQITPYGDYFWKQCGEEFLEFQPDPLYGHYRNIYYLHGALFLFSGEAVAGIVNDLKLKRHGDDCELLDVIDTRIRSGTLPLFVTEGTARQKARAIARSRYLTFALDKLTGAKEWMVVYGSALRDTDDHIWQKLNSKTRRLAVSIWVGEKSLERVQAEVLSIRQKLIKHEVMVFDSRGLFNV